MLRPRDSGGAFCFLERETFNLTATIISKDATRQIVAGFAKVAARNGELVPDTENDVVEPVELEKACHTFVEKSRKGTDGHFKPQAATVVACMVITPEKLMKMGIPEDVAKAATCGAWVEMRVDDPAVWAKVQKGTLRAFSIEGGAFRKKIKEAA
jgi:hypothetical protein